MEPNLPAPMRATRSGRFSAARARSRRWRFIGRQSNFSTRAAQQSVAERKAAVTPRAAGGLFALRQCLRGGYKATFRNRRAFVTTDTELMAIAAPAKMGESNSPKKG